MMTDPRELNELITRMKRYGAVVTVTPSADDPFNEIQISGAKGIGPHPMSPIYAAERMREWLWIHASMTEVPVPGGC